MARSGQYGAYVPTTVIWDPSQIYQANLDPELTKLFVTMYQNLNLMANVLNVKETGQYTTQFETVTNALWYPNPTLSSATATVATQRNVFRTTVNFGALPNTGLKSVAHRIAPTGAFSFTRIYAVASDPVGLTYIPIPFVGAAGGDIQLDVDAVNVNITTTSNRTNYTICYVVLEYIKT